MPLRSLLLALTGLLFALADLHAQGIDSVFTEVYHVQQDTVPGGPPLVTYRIFIDLAPGYELQMIYGDAVNQLKVSTTTEFFNDATNGVKYGGGINEAKLNTYPLALDSWLTINAVGEHYVAVPRAWDTDGSVLTCPPYKGYDVTRTANERPLCATDGLLAVDSVPAVVDFRLQPGYLGTIRGSVLHTMDGAWAVLGGTKGVTDRNVCLVAQISTTGALSYKLNVQLRGPDRHVVRYVSTEARGTEEVLYPGLVRR